MLFDLRGRGRRRTVQGVYLTLAILMGGGLVLFGVGAGNGLGGLLNAFTGNGSGSNQSQVVSAQEKTALKAVKADPNSASAWSALVQARWTTAEQGGTLNATTGVTTFTASGKKKLAQTTQAWQRYLQLTKRPDPNLAVLAARAYAYQGDYTGAAGAWQVEAAANPTELKGYECLAVSAYAAKQTRVGDLAMNKALTMVPKAAQVTLKTQISAAKTTPSIAQSC